MVEPAGWGARMEQKTKVEPEPGWRHGGAGGAGDHGRSGDHSGISKSHRETSGAEDPQQSWRPPHWKQETTSVTHSLGLSRPLTQDECENIFYL